MYLFSGIGQKP